MTVDGNALVLSSGSFSRRFIPTGPLVFHEVDGQNTLAFREDSSGRISHLFVSNSPSVALVKLPAAQTPLFNILLVVAVLAICLTTLLGWATIAFVRRGSIVPGQHSTPGSHRATWLAALMCFAIPALVGLTLIPLAEPQEIAFGVPPLVALALWCTPLVAALVAAVVACALLAWVKGYWWLSGRLYYTCVASAGVAFVWFLNHWNLLRFGP